MLNMKEIATIIVASLFLALLLTFSDGLKTFFFTLAIVLLVILINVVAKKVAGFYMESDVDVEFWKLDRYGFKPEKTRRPFPLGIFLPIVFALISLGKFVWMAMLVFDVRPKSYRAAKRHGLYSFSEMTEEHIGKIAAAGIIANVIFAIVGYLVGVSEFSKISLFYVFFNMIPISDLDGNKIFFGNIVLWSFLASIALIGMGYVFFII